MVFVGYSSRSKGYRLYDPNSGLVVTRRDVIFDEVKLGLPALVENKFLDIPQKVDINLPCPAETDSSINERPCPQRMSTRPHRPPIRFGIDEYTCTSVDHMALHAHNIVEPVNYSEVMTSPLSKEWHAAAEAEYNSLIENETWELVELPKHRRTIDCKWVFKAKYDSNGNVERFKGRVVARGFEQKHGIDYDETFAPVVKYPSL